MDIVFENPGLYHIGECIFKILDFQTQLTFRLLSKSFNHAFVKESSKVELPDHIRLKPLFLEWMYFMKKAKVPVFLVNTYLQNVFQKTNNPFRNNYRTLLAEFAIIGNSKIIELILKMRPNYKWHFGHFYALLSAAKYGHVNVAKCLKDLFSSNIPSNELEGALLLAIENGHLDVLRVLIYDGTNPDKIVNRKIIRAAACSDKIEMIKSFEQILDENSFENLLTERNSNGETIFHDIAFKGHLKVLKYLCQETTRFSRHPLQKDNFQRTPIHYAAERGHLEIVKFLASYTKNPNAADDSGWTPSTFARSLGFSEIESFLLNFPSLD